MAGYWWVAVLAVVAAAGWATTMLIALRGRRDDPRHETGADNRDDRRSQAERVSVWPEPRADPQPVALLNSSDEPVYEAVATFVLIDGSGPARGEHVPPELAGQRVTIGVIPPGRWRVRFRGGWDGMYPRLGVEVAFTDRAGVHWARRADGRLEQLPRGAFDHFELPRPLELVRPEPEEPSEPSERGVGHRGRIRAFNLGHGLGRRWAASCACGWIETTGSHPVACERFAWHRREAREPLAWRRSDRAAA